jgi:hypothetical protein
MLQRLLVDLEEVIAAFAPGNRSLTALEGRAVEVRSLHPAVRLPVALVWRRATGGTRVHRRRAARL